MPISCLLHRVLRPEPSVRGPGGRSGSWADSIREGPHPWDTPRPLFFIRVRTAALCSCVCLCTGSTMFLALSWEPGLALDSSSSSAPFLPFPPHPPSWPKSTACQAYHPSVSPLLFQSSRVTYLTPNFAAS